MKVLVILKGEGVHSLKEGGGGGGALNKFYPVFRVGGAQKVSNQ